MRCPASALVPVSYRLGVAILVASAALLGGARPSFAMRLHSVSSDPYRNTTSFHQTEVEPDTFSFGSTIVAAFQAGRFEDGGASNVGWATSTNGGRSWAHGFLPSTTLNAKPAGPYLRVSDPSVAYDMKHQTWLVATVALDAPEHVPAVLVSRSPDGRHWGAPIAVATTAVGNFDKDWIGCDDTASSPFFGNCYVQWDDVATGGTLQLGYSSDGGQTWNASTAPPTGVIGGQPIVQPSGNVIVPILVQGSPLVVSFVSTDGGATYTGPFTITSTLSVHAIGGNLRADTAFPSVEIDALGTVYVVWNDCSFEPGCTSNDLLLSTSADGISWTTPDRIPIDPIASGVDHFLPGLAVDRDTSGSTAHLALTYYYYPDATCDVTTCQLNVGFVSSPDGGATWTPSIQLAGPMQVTMLPLTNQGYMVGDYMSTSIVGGRAYPVFAVTTKKRPCTLGSRSSCNEKMVVPVGGLPVGQ
jgi:hypothetical protein